MQIDALSDIDSALYPYHSVHADLIEDYFGESVLRELTPQESARLAGRDLFFVAFTNRSGSTLLTELLHQAGLPVPPRAEVFNGEEVVLVSKDHGTPSFTDYFMSLTDGWARQGLAGFKIGPQQLFWLTRTGLLSKCRSVRLLNPLRADRMAQAVSLFIARQTGRWTTDMPAKGESAPVEYSRDGLVRALRTIHESQGLLDYYRDVHDLERLDIEYEALLADPVAQVRRVVEFLSYPTADLAAIDLASVTIRQQRGADNERLLRRFEADFTLP